MVPRHHMVLVLVALVLVVQAGDRVVLVDRMVRAGVLVALALVLGLDGVTGDRHHAISDRRHRAMADRRHGAGGRHRKGTGDTTADGIGTTTMEDGGEHVIGEEVTGIL